MSPEAALRAEIAAMRAEQAELREDLRHLVGRLLADHDRRDLARLLPAVWAVMGARIWSAADLAADVAGDVGDPNRIALLELLAEYTTEKGGLKRFGRFLGRVEGASRAGLQLKHIGEDGRGDGVFMVRMLKAGFGCSESVSHAGAEDDGSASCTDNLRSPQ